MSLRLSSTQAGTLDAAIPAGFELLARGRIAEAEQVCRRVLAAASTARAQLLACAIAEARGQLEQALQIVITALEEHGERGDLLLKQAQLLMQLRRRREGVAAARRAAEVSADDAEILQALGHLHMQRNEPADARPLQMRALQLLPNDPRVMYDLAMSHFYLNEMDESAAWLEKVLALAPGNGLALFVRAQLRTQTREANHVDELRRALLRPRLRTIDSISACFALAKELEDIGEYEESFAALSEGNRIKRSTLAYDVRTDQRAMENVAAQYTRTALDAIRGGDPAVGPIFIVGMPRTGTTLVERILGSHPEVISLGEITDFPAEMTALAMRTHRETRSADPDFVRASLQMDFTELGGNYLRAVQQAANGRRYTIDKLPFNFRYCGLIQKALPNAKLLHVNRDPIDTCYAVYKTLFINSYHYSYQLDELADFYVAYRRMMAHWQSVLTGALYELNYEVLVANPEAESRRLLEFCGLPWRDDVLKFHESPTASTTASAAQVRRPVYSSSVNKWRHFEKQLQPVVRKLAAAGIVDEHGSPLP